jgi:hypothetical protein
VEVIGPTTGWTMKSQPMRDRSNPPLAQQNLQR